MKTKSSNITLFRKKTLNHSEPPKTSVSYALVNLALDTKAAHFTGSIYTSKIETVNTVEMDFSSGMCYEGCFRRLASEIASIPNIIHERESKQFLEKL